MRLFFAVQLPATAAAAFAEVQRRCREAAGERARLSWSGGQPHLTLAFLGELPDAASAAQAGEAAVGGLLPIEVRLHGRGAFPNERRPRVLWLGVTDGASQLVGLADRLRGELRARGLPHDDKPFRPHLTLARVRPGGERDARAALEAAPEADVCAFTAAELVLVQSVLGRGGARHEVLRRHVLGA